MLRERDEKVKEKQRRGVEGQRGRGDQKVDKKGNETKTRKV